MKKLLILFLFSFTAMAETQPIRPINSVVYNKLLNSGANVLADSITFGFVDGAIAINSQSYLDAPLSGYNNSAADDVNIPANETWSISLIEVAGNYSDPFGLGGNIGPAVSVSVYIFEDLPTEPNTIDYASAFYVYENLNYIETGSGDFLIPLPNNATLFGKDSGATYWIAVRANMALFSGGQWGWTESSIQLGNYASQWQQSASDVLTGITGCVDDWKDRSICGMSDTNDQLAMILEGEIIIFANGFE